MKIFQTEFQTKPLLCVLALGLNTVAIAAHAQTTTPDKGTVQSKAQKAQAVDTKTFHVEDEGVDNVLDSFGDIWFAKEKKSQFDKAVAEAPQSAEAWSNRGAYFVYHGEWKNALPDLQQAIALDPKNAYIYMDLGKALRGLNRTEEAVAAFTKVHEVDPGAPVPFYAIGLTYLQAKQYDRAVENFSQRLALDDKNILSHIKRGQAYFAQRNFSAALQDLNQAIKISENIPNDFNGLISGASDQSMAQAYLFRSLILARRLDIVSKDDKFAPVMADAKKAVDNDEELAEEYIKLTAPMLTGDEQKFGALALLSGAAAALPEHTGVLLQLADAQHKTFRSAEAIKTYTQLLALEPERLVVLAALRGRAATYMDSFVPYKAEQWQPAIDDLSRAAFAEPKDADTVFRLCVAQYNGGHNDAGLRAIRYFLKDQPDNAYAHILLGLGLALNGDKDGATAEVKPWVAKLSTSETDKARQAVGSASGHYPDNAALKAILELIPAKAKDDAQANPYFV